MNFLEERILKDGIVKEGNVLKVDSFLNHQMDISCQTAHCGRRKPHFDFGEVASPIVPYRHLPQTLRGLTADCRSLV